MKFYPHGEYFNEAQNRNKNIFFDQMLNVDFN